jgi:tRNA(Arg) A34 adenosine deaminase TadA
LPYAEESPQDRAFLEQAIALARNSVEDDGEPFGAVVVVRGEVVGTGTHAVADLHDPTAHAEIMALRAAGVASGSHLLENGILYSSSEPCPMCLVACYWARVPRLVYAVSSYHVAINGFDDHFFYRQLALQNVERVLLDEVPVNGEMHAKASGVLADWAAKLPAPVVPRLW